MRMRTLILTGIACNGHGNAMHMADERRQASSSSTLLSRAAPGDGETILSYRWLADSREELSRSSGALAAYLLPPRDRSAGWQIRGQSIDFSRQVRSCVRSSVMLLLAALARTPLAFASRVRTPLAPRVIGGLTVRAAPPRLQMVDAADLLRADADARVARRAEQEQTLLPEGIPLLAVKQRGGPSAAGGFGGGGFGGGGAAPKVASKKGKKKTTASKSSKKEAKRPPSALAAEMKAQGVVRIDGALSPETVVALRDFVDAERIQAEKEIADGHCERTSRFADLLLVNNRADFLMPLRGASIAALHELVGEGSTLGALVKEIIGDEAVFQEIACLISEPGSKQQPLHPDAAWTKIPPLYACFVALQDVDLEMGPTVFLPGTHTQEAHAEFFGGDASFGHQLSVQSLQVPEEFLRSRKVVLGTLKAGDIAMYNQQVLHCGSGNDSDRIRRQFYISWRNPKCKSAVQCRASMRPSFRDKLTLGQIQAELKALNGATERVDENGGAGAFGELDKMDRQGDDKLHDKYQAGSLYGSMKEAIKIV